MDDNIKKMLNKQLNHGDLKKLKFLCIDIMPLKDWEYIYDTNSFLNKFFEKKNFNIEDLGFLFKKIGRDDLLSVLDFNENSTFNSKIKPLRELLLHISSNLNKENKNEIIFLSQIPIEDEDKLIDNEDLILYLEQKYSNQKDFLDYLLICCESINRFDIKSDIVDFTKKYDINEESIINNEFPSNEHYELYPGLCVIFNFENFNKSLTKRIGTKIDKDRLQILFRDLEFEILCFDDLSKNDLIKEVTKISGKILKEYNCFICFILSHGKKGSFYTSDTNLVSIREFCEYFGEKNCPFLNDKPKMFFICACQKEESNDIKKEEDLSFLNDCHITLASKLGTEAMRSRDNGTWFIQSLVEAFHSKAGYMSFSNLHTCILNGVHEKSRKAKSKEQIPIHVSNLKKHIKFNYKKNSYLLN